MAFTVKDLKEAIANLPDDMPVILQSDAEGNGYRWCCGVDPDGVLIEDCGWDAEIGDAGWSADDACQEPEDWKRMLDQPRILVIHPVN